MKYRPPAPPVLDERRDSFPRCPRHGRQLFQRLMGRHRAIGTRIQMIHSRGMNVFVALRLSACRRPFRPLAFLHFFLDRRRGAVSDVGVEVYKK